MNDTHLLLIEITLFLAALLALYRFAIGPTTLDRILAFDFLSVCVVAEVIVKSVEQKETLYLELLLTFSLLGFTTTLAFMDALFREKKAKIKHGSNEGEKE